MSSRRWRRSKACRLQRIRLPDVSLDELLPVARRSAVTPIYSKPFNWEKQAGTTQIQQYEAATRLHRHLLPVETIFRRPMLVFPDRRMITS